jgi:hypothetical protein
MFAIANGKFWGMEYVQLWFNGWYGDMVNMVLWLIYGCYG